MEGSFSMAGEPISDRQNVSSTTSRTPRSERSVSSTTSGKNYAEPTAQDRAAGQARLAQEGQTERNRVLLAQATPEPTPGPAPGPSPTSGTSPTPSPTPTPVPDRTPTPTTVPSNDDSPTPGTTTTTTPQSPGTPTPTTTPTPVPVPTPVPQGGTDPTDPLGNIGAGFLGTLPAAANVVPAQRGVKAQYAVGVLENIAAGKPPFEVHPQSVGGAVWTVSQGNPYVGSSSASTVFPVDVTVPAGANVVEFREADLVGIRDQKLPAATQLAEQQYRVRNNLAPTDQINSRGRSEITRNAKRLAESEMWKEVGRRVNASADGIGRVILDNSEFSKQGNGVFTVVGRKATSALSFRGGGAALLDVVRTNGIEAEKGVVEAAERLAEQGKISGRVQGVYRVGGRVLVVAGIAADAWQIYKADDKVREIVKVGGGWAGATAGVAAYNAATGPSNAAGPWAWAANAAGNLVAGGIGYFAGQKIAEVIYDLTVDSDPIPVHVE